MTIATEGEIQQITRAIVEVARPVRVVLFGSRARGDARADSDYDIMVEVGDDVEHRQLWSALYDAMRDNDWPVEVVLCTSDGFERTRDHPFYVNYDIAREGRVLYRRPGASVDWPGPSRVREGRDDAATRAAPWLKVADEDFQQMKLSLGSVTPSPGPIVFHAHGCVEKLFKAAIWVSGTVPPHIHNLKNLLELCPDALRGRDDVKQACEFLQKNWLKSRYPPEDGIWLTLDDARRAAAGATLVRTIFFREILNPGNLSS
jgi:predicted nucleotidyltransferase/HEPN domain-containing protein